MIETKIPKISAEAIATAAQGVGVVAMSAALTLSTLELPEDAKRVILPAQPAPVWADSGEKGHDNSAINREREETAPHYISYNVVQRTPARSGRG